VILLLKSLQSELVESRVGQRKRSISMKSRIYIASGLRKIVGVVGNDVPIKVRFSFSQQSIAEMTLFSIFSVDLLCCVRDFLHKRDKSRRRALPLIISGDIQGTGGLTFDIF